MGRRDDCGTPLLLQPARPGRLRNRFMLAPLTSQQSESHGTASEHELEWLRRCAKGGFALVQACAANIQAIGQAFAGQMGIYGDHHLEGLAHLAEAIRKNGCLSAVQLHHGGYRARFRGMGIRLARPIIQFTARVGSS